MGVVGIRCTSEFSSRRLLYHEDDQCYHKTSRGTRMRNLVVSYPKSGRTWLRVMLADLGVSADFTHLDANPIRGGWGRPYYKLSRNHALPSRWIFLHRDPRDVVVSYFHHICAVDRSYFKRAKYGLINRNPPKHLMQFVRNDGWGVEKIVHFNLNCHSLPGGRTFSYEQLKESPEKTLIEICKVFGKEFDQQLISEIVSRNTFSKMQEKEKRGDFRSTPFSNRFGSKDVSEINKLKVRKGKVGGWREEVDANTADFMNLILDKHSYFRRMEVKAIYTRDN